MDGLNILHCVADGSEVLPERLLRNYNSASAVIRVERERRGIFQPAVEEENDMMVVSLMSPKGLTEPGSSPR